MPNGLFTLKQQVLATSQGAWPNQKTPAVDYLVVAGGGGGGFSSGGGGGAGGLLQGVINVTAGSAITATVGAGGAADNNGNNSVFGSIASTAGGKGGPGVFSGAPANGSAGGSGGGAGSDSGNRFIGGQGTFGQGNAGGREDPGTSYAAGGGGGAGTVGLNGFFQNNGGNGGAGIASDISGTRTAYAGGGGGGDNGGSAPQSSGGVGGGGAGGKGNASTGVAGTANTGGGGGGGGTLANGAAGGSGVVIISYPDVYAAPTATTGSPTVSTSGSGSISFNGSTQWATYASNAAWTLGSTFTIEAWVYATNLSGGSRRICQSDAGFDLAVGPTGVVLFNAATTVTTVLLNTWTHIAFVCSGGTSTLYINGVASSFTGTNTGVNVAGTSTLTVGTFQTNSGFVWQGFISNFRIVKGSAVYTGNFTPSTTPLTAITNTQLLLSANSGGFLADASSNGFATTSSSAVSPTWDQLSPFATGLGFKNRVYRWTSSGSITF